VLDRAMRLRQKDDLLYEMFAHGNWFKHDEY